MTATRPTDAGLRAAIMAAPDDDGPRLVYADWLDENGESERAEFIRVQVELARLERKHYIECTSTTVRSMETSALRRREQELFRVHGAEWFGPTACLTPPNDRERQAGGEFRVVRRGFIESVTLPTLMFVGDPCGRCRGRRYDPGDIWNAAPNPLGRYCPACHGTGRVPGIAADLFRTQPVTTVTLSDAEPWADDLNNERATYRWQWDQREQNEWDGQGTPPWMIGDLPWQLFKLIKRDPHHRRVDVRTGRMARVAMKTFDTFDAAVAALSDACVRWGREQAGLEPLKK